MSFVLAYNLGTVGLVVADTRLNLISIEGVSDTHDERELSVSLPNDEVIEWHQCNRKLSKIDHGFCAAAGDALITRRCLDFLISSKYTSIGERARALSLSANRTATLIAHELYDISQFPRSSISILESTHGQLELNVIRLSDGEVINRNVNYCAYWPSELPKIEQELLIKVIENPVIPTSRESLFDFVVHTLHIFNRVHQLSQTVSDRFELGMLVLQPQSTVEFTGTGLSSLAVRDGVPYLMSALQQNS